MEISAVEGIPIALIAILIRIWPLFIPNFFEASDSWFHLWRTSEIERNGYRVPAENTQFILKGRTCYPPLLHYLMVLIPDRLRQRWSLLISPICDLLIFVPFLFLWWFGLWIESTSQLFVCLVAYFLSPVLLQFHATCMYSPKPRNMGRLFLVCSLVFFYGYHTSGSIVLLFLSSVFCGLLLISSKFGLQAFLFICLCIVYWYTSILIVMGLGLAFAVMITSGFYLSTLREHILHQKMYFKRMRYYSTASHVNDKRDLLLLLNPANLLHRTSEYVYVMLYKCSWSRSIFIIPEVSLFFFLLFFEEGYLNGILTPGNSFLVLWSCGCLLAFFTTSTKLLISLGQPERYLEYLLFPAVILLSRCNFYDFFGSVWIFLLFCMFFYFVTNAKYFYNARHRIKDYLTSMNGIAELRRYFQEINGRRIMCVPMKMALNFADIHQHQYFWASPFVEPYVKPEFWDETFRPARFPFPKSLVHIQQKYDIDTIVFEKQYCAEYLKDLEDLGAREVKTMPGFIVYGVSKQRDNSFC